MFEHSVAAWVFLGMWMLVTSILIPVGLTLISAQESDRVQTYGALFLMAGVLSAGGFLLVMAERH